jgi:hypothetical protein
VQSARVDLASERADVRLKPGASLNSDNVREAVASVVIFPRIRRVLSRMKKAAGVFRPP